LSPPRFLGPIAQLVERLPCKQEVIGSIPIRSKAVAFEKSRAANHDLHICLESLAAEGPRERGTQATVVS
jgi:hypothetical protein